MLLSLLLVELEHYTFALVVDLRLKTNTIKNVLSVVKSLALLTSKMESVMTASKKEIKIITLNH